MKHVIFLSFLVLVLICLWKVIDNDYKHQEFLQQCIKTETQYSLMPVNGPNNTITIMPTTYESCIEYKQIKNPKYIGPKTYK